MLAAWKRPPIPKSVPGACTRSGGLTAVATTLELYLRDRVIRGDVKEEFGQRPIDLLNGARGGILVLNDAWSASLHASAPPSHLTRVRVQRSQILIAVPQDPAPLPARQFRLGYVEKRPVRSAVGLGPFTVTGAVHIGLHEQSAVGSLEHDAGGRFFIPFTAAVLKSEYDPTWSLETELLFVNRAEITYTTPTPDPEA